MKGMAAGHSDIRTQENGLILTELAAVLLILGILSAIAVPVFSGISAFSQRAAAREMAAWLREARHAAISTGRTTEITFYLLSGRYRLDLPQGRVWVRLPQGVTIAGTNFPEDNSRPTLTFRFTGAPNRGGHVMLRDADGKYLYVIVTPVTGRVRLSTVRP